jgi:hypothetical protein
MCTVTFIARQKGYCLGMNRDEKLTRPIGLPPKQNKVRGCTVISPSEPGGGTWIAVNGHGATLALINWYSITARVGGKAVSRGEVINPMSAASSADFADAALHGLPLNRINPFRLIGVFPVTGEIIEWRWNLKQLVRKNLPWKSQQWISSGFDEPTAQRVRGKSFQRAGRQHSAGSLDWLRRLHRSHSPQTGPFSTCMHRTDAGTVSYSESMTTRLAFSSAVNIPSSSRRLRVFEPTRRILDAPDAATQSNRNSSRCHLHWPDGRSILQSLIEQSGMRQSPNGEFVILGLRTQASVGVSASGESGAEGGEERIAKRSRSATPLPSRRRKPAALAAHRGCPFVTSARFAKWNGCGREGDGPIQQPVERSKTVRWSRRETR